MVPDSLSVRSGVDGSVVSARFTTRVNTPLSRSRRTSSDCRKADMAAASLRSSSSLMAGSVTGNGSTATT